ncbi:hypothetical protein C8R47DRAFT_1244601 [Mycena vitilis]|nr:hypothetical protein C8R47DRAFT_1244601 [Mycena vitilis]
MLQTTRRKSLKSVPSIADFAQELIDLILDFLHEDRESLLRSSLVKRAWLSTSRHHVFSRISLECFYVGGLPGTFRDNVHSFLEISHSPHWTFADMLRTVLIDIGPGENLLDRVVRSLGRTSIQEVFYVDRTASDILISPRLGSTESPKLRYCRQPALSCIALRVPQLRKFSYNSTSNIREDVFSLITDFPMLQSLTLHTYSDKSRAEGTSMPSLTLSVLPTANLEHLRTLRLRFWGSNSAQILEWFQHVDLQLETLDVEILSSFHNGWGSIAPLNAALKANRESLRNLRLCVDYVGDHSHAPNFILTRASEGQVNLKILTSLRKLSLRTHDMEAACSALESLPDLPSLQSVKVDQPAWLVEEASPCPCDASSLHSRFAAVMRRPKFSQLTSFSFLLPNHFDEEMVREVKTHFQQWGPRVLRVGISDKFEHQTDSWNSVRDQVYPR